MKNLKKQLISPAGYFGEFGGRYVPETLVPYLDNLAKEFYEAIEDQSFIDELAHINKNYVGRPSPLYFCENLTSKLGGAQIYLKNEGLNHTGAHKINHCVGQIILAKRMGKKRIIAETGAGQHGLATATVCAKAGMECVIYMGAKDYKRQKPNVFLMERMGAKVISVEKGGQVLRDAINEAMRDLITDPIDTHYLLGTVCGPHPYPAMNTYFQSVIGREVKEQIPVKPDYLVACVGGGSNAMGLFYEFLDDEVKLYGVEAGGKGITKNDHGFDHAARFQSGFVGISEGFKSIFLQENGYIKETSSISAGLDYSGVGPQISYLEKIGRLEMVYAKDPDVLNAFETLARSEGVLAALESCHAVSYVLELAPKLSPKETIVFNCSGRGDKDLFITAKHLDGEAFNNYLTEYIND